MNTCVDITSIISNLLLPIIGIFNIIVLLKINKSVRTDNILHDLKLRKFIEKINEKGDEYKIEISPDDKPLDCLNSVVDNFGRLYEVYLQVVNKEDMSIDWETKYLAIPNLSNTIMIRLLQFYVIYLENELEENPKDKSVATRLNHAKKEMKRIYPKLYYSD